MKERITAEEIAGIAFDRNRELLEVEEEAGFFDIERELLKHYTWEELPQWHKDFYIEYTRLILMSDQFSTPDQIQDLWIARWEKEGWKVGASLDPDKKTNPYLDRYEYWAEDRKKRATVCFIVANYYRREWETKNENQ